jgi:hypothetical protein
VAVFSFSPETGRYRLASGRFVPDVTVREALDTVIQAQADQMRSLTQSLIDGAITLADWQRQSIQAIKLAHLEGLALARGGWQQLTQADFGWVGQRLRVQYTYLSQFAQQIADGSQTLGAGALVRAEMYAEAGRATHREAQRRLAEDRGMVEERNQLGAVDHCGGCVSQTAAGWVPLGTLVPVGSRDCLSRCGCWMQWRMAPAKGSA